MLEKIKSLYFRRLLFSYVDEKIKLEIIRYNKNIQKILDKNIIDYKLIGKKYTIIDKNGNGKEYDILDDKLIFEGEYIKGKKNGKGKEYRFWSDELIFEGEYLNGKRN